MIEILEWISPKRKNLSGFLMVASVPDRNGQERRRSLKESNTKRLNELNTNGNRYRNDKDNGNWYRNGNA